jgi:hypothetical protein
LVCDSSLPQRCEPDTCGTSGPSMCCAGLLLLTGINSIEIISFPLILSHTLPLFSLSSFLSLIFIKVITRVFSMLAVVGISYHDRVHYTAQFNAEDIAIYQQTSTLFVADSSNNIIRKITPQGRVIFHFFKKYLV